MKLKSLRFALVLAVTALAVGCGPEEEMNDGAPTQETVGTKAPANLGTAEQELTVYRWVSTNNPCKVPMNVYSACIARGYDGGSASQCGKTGTTLIQCYTRT
ncbi:hypothetical protein [Corallococcus aberystwythensis]|uniref:Lipoprotein n=1 Tax=Corallococcus aberystwythensis TaxID=2316722 RepID=A0A3A8Q5L4_9BACT|nr:hypothetical protein [Corallococcus aberystwythensis]RKH63973.1 hypothetical protein D7W81_19405 [Corallococcus aberystwythensis]